VEKLFKCADPNCNSLDFELRKAGPNTGLYCAKCGKYIKFLGKAELKLAEEYIAKRALIGKMIDVGEGYEVVVHNHTIIVFYKGTMIFSHQDAEA
jgi:hypothetical protein